MHSGYSCFFVVWYAFYWAAVHRRGETPNIFERYATTPSRMVKCSVAAMLLSFVCAYTWYLSLTRTTVAANNSIYQVCVAVSPGVVHVYSCLCPVRVWVNPCANALWLSCLLATSPCHSRSLLWTSCCRCVVLAVVQSAAALVYAMSVVFLREPVTAMKTVAVALSVLGVVLVSTAPQHTDANDTHPSAAGYVWLMVSVLAYAGFEVRVFAPTLVSWCCSSTTPTQPCLVVWQPT